MIRISSETDCPGVFFSAGVSRSRGVSNSLSLSVEARSIFIVVLVTMLQSCARAGKRGKISSYIPHARRLVWKVTKGVEKKAELFLMGVDLKRFKKLSSFTGTV